MRKAALEIKKKGEKPEGKGTLFRNILLGGDTLEVRTIETQDFSER